ncbi:hypothetical protein [Spongiimicrobium salis]|uniref:hypothetical protein n=1 Tax=Spongiimicrobium salis TaxID=1667022 RepID=UPI00374D026D
MKAFKYIILGMIFLSITLESHAQKTGVQVNFSIDSNVPFLFSFGASEVDDLKAKMHTSMINTFNQHIGFLDFNEADSDYELQVVLKNEVDESGFLEEYKVLFAINGTELKHEWLFLNINETVVATASAETLWDTFQAKWKSYVKESYNQDFVANLFKEVAVTTPDKVHYHETTNLKEVILPFDPKRLNIDPDQSKFRALANCTIDGINSKCPIENASYGGIVNGEMEVPSSFNSCIRIRLDGPNLNALSDGKIFITSYRFRSYPNEEIGTPDSFVESITE